MRSPFLLVPTALAVAVLLGSQGLQAQNPFGDVTNDPRPSEFLHWDAETFDQWHRELQDRIDDGDRTWDTKFTFFSALEGAPYREHDISIVHREGYTQPEIHETKWDIYVILEGSGTVLIGGERVGWVEGRPPEEQRPELQGATEFEVEEGDIVHVPARSWHQLLLEPEASMTYMLINISR